MRRKRHDAQPILYHLKIEKLLENNDVQDGNSVAFPKDHFRTSKVH